MSSSCDSDSEVTLYVHAAFYLLLYLFCILLHMTYVPFSGNLPNPFIAFSTFVSQKKTLTLVETKYYFLILDELIAS